MIAGGIGKPILVHDPPVSILCGLHISGDGCAKKKKMTGEVVLWTNSGTRGLSESVLDLHRVGSSTVYAERMDAVDVPSQWEFNCNLEVNYGSVENASIVYAALAVDKEVFQRVQSLEVPMARKCDATRLKECLLLSMHGVQSIVSHPWWLEENIIPRPRMHIFPLT
ncbi:hypothetical protein Scep_025413 [Stephania cephalantha]|uniref:Uncharacterized protein n=1 Tax=Stephania cephalantha TaxID=152367 RepID=A0AAP0HPC1_9MAGN